MTNSRRKAQRLRGRNGKASRDVGIPFWDVLECEPLVPWRYGWAQEQGAVGMWEVACRKCASMYSGTTADLLNLFDTSLRQGVLDVSLRPFYVRPSASHETSAAMSTDDRSR